MGVYEFFLLVKLFWNCEILNSLSYDERMWNLYDWKEKKGVRVYWFCIKFRYSGYFYCYSNWSCGNFFFVYVIDFVYWFCVVVFNMENFYCFSC